MKNIAPKHISNINGKDTYQKPEYTVYETETEGFMLNTSNPTSGEGNNPGDGGTGEWFLERNEKRGF